MSIINKHTLIYWHSRCDCKLWNAFWFYCGFRVFSYTIIDHACLNWNWTFTDCLFNQYWSVKMSDMTSSYGTLLEFIAFFRVFSYIIDEHSCLKYCIIIKLSQIVCLITYILIYWHVSYGRFFGLIGFFWNFNLWYVTHLHTLWKFSENNFECHSAVCNCMLWMGEEYKSKRM